MQLAILTLELFCDYYFLSVNYGKIIYVKFTIKMGFIVINNNKSILQYNKQ